MSDHENMPPPLNWQWPAGHISLLDYGTGYLAEKHVQLTDAIASSPEVGLTSRENQWRTVLNTELNARKSICKFLIAHTPDPTYETYDDPKRYIDEARNVNMAGEVTTYDYDKHFRERNKIIGLARNYLRSNTDRLEPLLQTFPANVLSNSFTRNMLHLTLTGYVLAVRDYNLIKNAIIRRWIPDAYVFDAERLFESAKEDDTSRATLERIKHEVATVPWPEHRLPIFSFLQDDLQTEIVRNIGNEWLVLCNLAQRYDNLLVTDTSPSLAKLSVTVVNDAIERHPELAPEIICQTFRLKPNTFYATLKERAKPWQRMQYLEQEPGTPPSPTFDVAKVPLTRNQEVIHALLDHPLVNRDIVNLQINQQLVMTKPGKPITRKDFEASIDANLELFGRVLCETTMPFNPNTPRLGRWTGVNIAGTLCGEKGKTIFNGTRRDLTITRLPVTEEDLRAHFKDDYDPERVRPEQAARLVCTANVQSSGRKRATASIHVLIIAEANKGYDTVNRYIMQEGNTGEGITESYHQESTAVANVLGTGVVNRGIKDYKGGAVAGPHQVNINRRPQV